MKNILILAEGEFGRKIVDYVLAEHPQDSYLFIVFERSELAKHLDSLDYPFVPIPRDTKDYSTYIPKELEFELGICAWWPKILPKEMIVLPRMGILNIHPGLLPHLKGKHTSFWAIVEERAFGVSMHRLDETIDGGPIFAQKLIPTDWESTGGSLALEAQIQGFELFCEYYSRIRLGNIQSMDQPQGEGSYHHSSEMHERSKLNLNEEIRVKDLLNLLRAKTHPQHLGCTFDEGNNSYEVKIQIRKLEEK